MLFPSNNVKKNTNSCLNKLAIILNYNIIVFEYNIYQFIQIINAKMFAVNLYKLV